METELEIAPGVYSLGQQQGGHVHAYLFDDGTQLTLVDTLFDTDAQRVLTLIRHLGRTVTDLKHIIITHAHRSHLGGLAQLKDLSGATVYAHEWEADIIAGQRKAQAVTFWPSHPLLVYAPVYYLQLGLALGFGKHPPCPVDHLVAGGDRIGPLQVIDASGHSPGHLALYWEERKVLVAGDAIATWPALSAGWPAFNLNVTQHRAALARLAEVDAEVVGVGHGEPIRSAGSAQVRRLAHVANS